MKIKNLHNYKEEILGEYYIPQKQFDNKKLIVETINRFINKENTFKPDGSSKYSLYGSMRLYAEKNGLFILDYTYFVRGLSGLRQNQPSDFAIMYDSKINEKRVYLIRTQNSVNEMSTKLGIATLIELYEMLVVDVVDHKLFLRERKEIVQNLSNELRSPNFFIEYTKDPLIFTVFKYVSYNIKNIMSPKIEFNKKYIQVNLHNTSTSKPVLTQNVTFHSLNNIRDVLDYSGRQRVEFSDVQNVNSIIDVIKKEYDRIYLEKVKNLENSRSEIEALMTILPNITSE